MRNLFILAFLAMVGYLIYNQFIKRDPPPIAAYKMVMDSWVNGDLAKVRIMCEEPRLETIFEVRSLNNLAQPVGVNTVVEHSYTDLTATPGQSANEYAVGGRLTVLFNPPGVTSSVYGSFKAVLNIQLGLRQVGKLWKITSVKIERIEIGEHRLDKK